MPPQQDLLAPFRSRSGYEGSSLVKLLHGERENILSDLREHLQCVDSDRWGLDLQVWEGPLQGVVHQKGHFPQLEEAPAEEAVAKTDGVAAGDAEGLAEDLRLLQDAQQHTRHVWFDLMGTEGQYAMHPIILSVPPQAARPQESEGGGAAEEAGADVVLHRAVLAACGLPPDVFAAELARPKVFGTQEEWISYLDEMVEGYCDDGDDDDGPSESREMYAHMMAAARLVAGAVEAPVLQVILGDDGLFNPLPVLWVGRSTASSGNVIGLMTAVAWT